MTPTDELDAREYLASGGTWTSHIALFSLPIRLSDEWEQDIPPLNAILVNAQTHLPGHGANAYIKRFLNLHARRSLTDANRDALAEESMQSVWDYATGWDAVAKHFGHKKLAPVQVLLESKQETEPIEMPPLKKQNGGNGESDQHQALKLWAVKNPQFFSAYGRFKAGKNEQALRSGDLLDTYFENAETRLAVEVKASNAPDSELFRGIFQCIKYRATLRAMQLADGEPPNAQAVLVTTKSAPAEARRLAKRLRVKILKAETSAEGPVTR